MRVARFVFLLVIAAVSVAGRDRQPLCLPCLIEYRAGDVDICTSTEVLQEILYRYSSLKRRDLAASVYDLFVQLSPVVFAVTLADTDRAKAIVMANDRVTVRDAIHAAVMLNNSITEIATFDEGFDAIAEVRRAKLM